MGGEWERRDRLRDGSLQRDLVSSLSPTIRASAVPTWERSQVFHRLQQRELCSIRGPRPCSYHQTRMSYCSSLHHCHLSLGQYRLLWGDFQERYPWKWPDYWVSSEPVPTHVRTLKVIYDLSALFFRNIFGQGTERVCVSQLQCYGTSYGWPVSTVTQPHDRVIYFGKHLGCLVHSWKAHPRTRS